MKFQYTIIHVPGKELYTPDTLSRVPLSSQLDNFEVMSAEDIEFFIHTLTDSLPADKDRLNIYRQAQASDEICSNLIAYCISGWPSHKPKGELRKYWNFQGEMSLSDNLLLYGARIVVPKSMREETLQKIHQGHQGIQQCHFRVKNSVWWLGVSKDIEALVKSCPECQKSATLSKEPLIKPPLPSYPWEKVASDLFELNKTTYLLVVDYFSRFLEIQKLTSTTSANVITVLKSIFARHGIPATLVTDNGPQFISNEMNQFSSTYRFRHVTSSPHYHQSNGQAERAVKTVKALLTKSTDLYLALLSYRATPLPWCGLSPAQLLMGRIIRTDVPQHPTMHVPTRMVVLKRFPGRGGEI